MVSPPDSIYETTIIQGCINDSVIINIAYDSGREGAIKEHCSDLVGKDGEIGIWTDFSTEGEGCETEPTHCCCVNVNCDDKGNSIRVQSLTGFQGDGECDSEGYLFDNFGLDYNCIEYNYEAGDCFDSGRISSNQRNKQSMINMHRSKIGKKQMDINKLIGKY